MIKRPDYKCKVPFLINELRVQSMMDESMPSKFSQKISTNCHLIFLNLIYLLIHSFICLFACLFMSHIASTI